MNSHFLSLSSCCEQYTDYKEKRGVFSFGLAALLDGDDDTLSPTGDKTSAQIHIRW